VTVVPARDDGAADLVTERLFGAVPVAADLPAYEQLFQSPEVERWLRPSPLPRFSLADVRARLWLDAEHWTLHGYGPWALRDRVSDGFVGRAGLLRATLEGEEVVEIAWSLLPACWGTGLATEAATASVERARGLGLHNVIARTLPTNVASRRVMEKAGLAPAGETVHAGLPHVLYRLAA
jgi:ribosomal-protein-alanine N-acetyltransferase